jgi:hypothetical protein
MIQNEIEFGVGVERRSEFLRSNVIANEVVPEMNFDLGLWLFLKKIVQRLKLVVVVVVVVVV